MPILGKLRDDFSNVVDESHVEHPVRFVENEVLQFLEAYHALLDQIEQTTRSRDQNIDALGKSPFLGKIAHAAENACARNRRELLVHFKAVGNLDRKFPCREQDQDADWLLSFPDAILENVLQDGKRERGRLAGSCLGDAHQVLAFENGRNRFFLDWRGICVAGVGDRSLEAFVQGKF